MLIIATSDLHEEWCTNQNKQMASKIVHKSPDAIMLLGDICSSVEGFRRCLSYYEKAKCPVYVTTGNHDMWMFDYLTNELNIPIIRTTVQFKLNNTSFFIGHGDGLGPGDYFYKGLKIVFANRFCQWLFARIHPNLGIGIAHLWSKKSRISSNAKEAKRFGEEEWLLQFCKEEEEKEHHDYYIFGHRHVPMELEVAKNSLYINLGEWVNYCTYAEFDGTAVSLKEFK